MAVCKIVPRFNVEEKVDGYRSMCKGTPITVALVKSIDSKIESDMDDVMINYTYFEFDRYCYLDKLEHGLLGKLIFLDRENHNMKHIYDLVKGKDDDEYDFHKLRAIGGIPWAQSGLSYLSAGGGMVLVLDHIISRDLPLKLISSDWPEGGGTNREVYGERYIDAGQKDLYDKLVGNDDPTYKELWSDVQKICDLLAEGKSITSLLGDIEYGKEEILSHEDQEIEVLSGSLDMRLLNDFLYIVAATLIEDNKSGKDLDGYLAAVLKETIPFIDYETYISLLELVLFNTSSPSRIVSTIDEQRKELGEFEGGLNMLGFYGRPEDFREILGYRSRFERLTETVLEERLKIEPYSKYIENKVKSMYPDDTIGFNVEQ